MVNALEFVSKLKEELDALRPLSDDVLAQVEQKLRIELNYNSNAIEGNVLTLGETRSLILHGLTAHGKPLRDHLDVEGHDSAVKAIEAAVKDEHELNEAFIRNLHRTLLKEPYVTNAVTPDGQSVGRTISIGNYKTTPNNVRTSTGEIYYFTPPEQVKPAMSDLIDWYRTKEREGEHPIVIAATLHYRFVRIHPFDDGNGRMARLLMNMILIKHGYTMAMIREDNRSEYLANLELADKTEDITAFIGYIASCCEYSLNLYLRAAHGEPIDDIEDIDKEIVLFKKSLQSATDGVLPVKDYFDSTLYPFYDYCSDKTRQFSDVFGSVFTLISVFVNTTDGKVVSLCESSRTLPSLADHSDTMDRVRSLSVDISAYLTTFQGRQGEHILVTVNNTAETQRCLWTFSIGASSVRFEHSGQDLEDLKRQFNELLREVIKALKQKPK